MILLNPLLLVISDGDILARCHTTFYITCVNKSGDCVGLWAECRTCLRIVRRRIPSLLRYSVASLPALLLEEGDLAPNSS